MRIAGVTLDSKKHIVIALQAVYGVGLTRAQKICAEVNVAEHTKVNKISPEQEEQLRQAVNQYTIEGDLRREIALAIKHKKDIRCYAGLRLVRGLPLKGRTKTNAKTCKRRSGRDRFFGSSK